MRELAPAPRDNNPGLGVPPCKAFYNVGDRLVRRRQPNRTFVKRGSCFSSVALNCRNFLIFIIFSFPFDVSNLTNLRDADSTSKEPQRADETDRTIVLSTTTSADAAAAALALVAAALLLRVPARTAPAAL